MRQNLFGEQILQPTDNYGDFETAWESKFGELPEEGAFFVELDPTEDDNFAYGGEFRDNASGEGIAFDGFESVDAARYWLAHTLRIPAGDIQILDE